MNTLVVEQVRSITKEDARIITDKIREGINNIRQNLLYMYTTEGWRALGYHSWHEYLVNEFDTHHSYLRRQTSAALLESGLSDDGSLIGKHRESHMRQIIDVLDDDELRKEAYWYAERLIGDSKPKATHYKVAAKMVYLREYSPKLHERVESGELSVDTAYCICKVSEEAYALDDMLAYSIVLDCSDCDLAKSIVRDLDKSSELWLEIALSRCIPAFPEPVPIGKATIHNLLAWMSIDSAERRATIIEVNRAYYQRRNELHKSLYEACVKHIGELPGDIVEILKEIERLDDIDDTTTRTE